MYPWHSQAGPERQQPRHSRCLMNRVLHPFQAHAHANVMHNRGHAVAAAAAAAVAAATAYMAVRAADWRWAKCFNSVHQHP